MVIAVAVVGTEVSEVDMVEAMEAVTVEATVGIVRRSLSTNLPCMRIPVMATALRVVITAVTADMEVASVMGTESRMVATDPTGEDWDTVARTSGSIYRGSFAQTLQCIRVRSLT